MVNGECAGTGWRRWERSSEVSSVLPTPVSVPVMKIAFLQTSACLTAAVETDETNEVLTAAREKCVDFFADVSRSVGE